MPANDYKVFERVGSGAQGAVYRGLQLSTGDTVAIKRIDVSHLNEKERATVLQEVKVLSTLSTDPHPNIMQYRESYVDDEALNIVLQWSSHGTLQDRYNVVVKDGNGSLSEDEMWRTFLSLCVALDHVHARNILHRDVKMANVFLHVEESEDFASGTTRAQSGGAGGAKISRVQLGDFGVSCILDDRSRAETVVGTPYYLSPELCMGKKYTSKSDVWSLGVLLFILLNHKMPFEASNYAALIMRIVKSQCAKPEAKSVGKYDPILHKIATWCMQKNESSRPSARELLSQPECQKAALRLGVQLPPEVAAMAAKLAAKAENAAKPRGAVVAGGIPGTRPLSGKPAANAPPVQQPVSAKQPSSVPPSDRPLPMLPRGDSQKGLPQTRRLRNRNAPSTPSLTTRAGSRSQIAKPASKRDVNAVRALPDDGGSSSGDDSDNGGTTMVEGSPMKKSDAYRQHVHSVATSGGSPLTQGSSHNAHDASDITMAILQRLSGDGSVPLPHLPPGGGADMDSVVRDEDVYNQCHDGFHQELPAATPSVVWKVDGESGQSSAHTASHVFTAHEVVGHSNASIPEELVASADDAAKESLIRGAPVPGESLVDGSHQVGASAYDAVVSDVDALGRTAAGDLTMNQAFLASQAKPEGDDVPMSETLLSRMSLDDNQPLPLELDTSKTPLDVLQTPEQVTRRADEILNEGEELVGVTVFAELVDVLLQDRPLDGQDLRSFIAVRVAPERVADAMHLVFRYVFLVGELSRLNEIAVRSSFDPPKAVA